MNKHGTVTRKLLAAAFAVLLGAVLFTGASLWSTGDVSASARAESRVSSLTGSEPPVYPMPNFDEPSRITNPWLPISAHRRWVLRGMVDGKRVRSVKRLLGRTEIFDVRGQSLRAAIVRDSAYYNGTLHEIALDYYAQANDGTVYYLGEDVDYFDKRGAVDGHHGSFRYGEDTRTLGVAMPADPASGDRFTFERIPGQGSETNRVRSTGAAIQVPAATYRSALKVRGFVLPEREREVKWFGRGVGLLAEQGPDGRIELTKVR